MLLSGSAPATPGLHDGIELTVLDSQGNEAATTTFDITVYQGPYVINAVDDMVFTHGQQGIDVTLKAADIFNTSLVSFTMQMTSNASLLLPPGLNAFAKHNNCNDFVLYGSLFVASQFDEAEKVYACIQLISTDALGNSASTIFAITVLAGPSEPAPPSVINGGVQESTSR